MTIGDVSKVHDLDELARERAAGRIMINGKEYERCPPEHVLRGGVDYFGFPSDGGTYPMLVTDEGCFHDKPASVLLSVGWRPVQETTLSAPSALTAGERLRDAAVDVYREARKAGKDRDEAILTAGLLAMKAAGFVPDCECGRPSTTTINGVPKCDECGREP